jgi:HAD superfamily hydrolase (TIGR01450 family)
VKDRIHLSFLDRYDGLLLDLDGTVMHGARPIPHAAASIVRAREHGTRIGFVTNNASRSPQQVVDHLKLVEINASPEEIATSPQIAVQVLSRQVEAGATILVIGGAPLAEEVRSAGLVPVHQDEAAVAAVIQGFSPQLGWSDLAEGAYALNRGVPWVATNTDATLPTERGMAPGNGSLVRVLVHATGRTPVVAGKPEPAMFSLAAERLGLSRPLAVGDRLDTEIEGGNRAGIDTLLVLTGVDDIRAALYAPAVRRPSWIVADMSALDAPAVDAVVSGPDADGTASARCGATSARLTTSGRTGRLELHGGIEDPRTLRAALRVLAVALPEQAFTGVVIDQDGRTVWEDTAAGHPAAPAS